jgi:hypothetical protein
MVSDYCDFTMSSTFGATGQLLDMKRAGDRKLARLRRRLRGDAEYSALPQITIGRAIISIDGCLLEADQTKPQYFRANPLSG